MEKERGMLKDARKITEQFKERERELDQLLVRLGIKAVPGVP